MTREKLQVMARKAAEGLAEHGDGALVLMTWRDNNGHTQMLDAGSGNAYMLIGVAKEYVETRESMTLAHQINLLPPDDDGEWKGTPA